MTRDLYVQPIPQEPGLIEREIRRIDETGANWWETGNTELWSRDEICPSVEEVLAHFRENGPEDNLATVEDEAILQWRACAGAQGEALEAEEAQAELAVRLKKMDAAEIEEHEEDEFT